MSSSFSKHLEISFDIYRLPLSPAPAKTDLTRQSKKNSAKSLAEIMSQAGLTPDKPGCNCGDPRCSNASLKTNIFVEQREGDDSVFLNEDDLAPAISSEKAIDKKEPDPRLAISRATTALIQKAALIDFDPFKLP
ncbi:hypothetical protein GC174_04940 [bacterium]|nr:hypothetical protein [bacterium]